MDQINAGAPGPSQAVGSKKGGLMKVRNKLTGEIREAELTTEHSASSYGQPVMVLNDGQAVDAVWWEPVKENSVEGE